MILTNLLTGSSGKLGRELVKIGSYFTPKRSELDITDRDNVRFYFDTHSDIDLIVAAAAYTNVIKAETEKDICWNINVNGTRNLAQLGIPILYISTEHVFDGERGNYAEEDTPNPANYYALTKLIGEMVLNDKSKIIRLSLKPRPFPYPKAFVDQFTTADYVDVIAKEVKIAIEHFDDLPRIMNVGTPRKSIYDLARQSREVEPISRLDNKLTKSPYDTSLDLSRWIRFKKGLE